MSEWMIIQGAQIKKLEETDLQSIKTAASPLQTQTKYQTQLIQLSQTKLKQVKSLRNYLPVSFHKYSLQVLNSCLPAFGPCDNMFNSKLKSLRQKIGGRQQKAQELMKTCKKRLALCFSSKWRHSQQILYLLVHKFISSERQTVKLIIHVLNHKEVILQTISNIDQKQCFQEIVRTIQRSYRRFQSIVVILPETCTLSLDKISYSFKELGKYQILIIFAKGRDQIRFADIEQVCSWRHFQNANGIRFSFANNSQILLSFNQKLRTNKLRFLLTKAVSLASRELETAQLLQKVSYFSGFFCKKQLYLRFYAYLFNLITLEGMQSQQKQSIIGKIIDWQLESFEEMESQGQNNLETPETHTIKTHPTQLICLICRKRTRIRCQKCSLHFNKLFGLCQRECFSVFHDNTPKYIEKVEKNKKIYKTLVEDHQSQQDEQGYQRALNGRKMRKNEESMSMDEGRKQGLESVEQIKNRWKQSVAQNEHNFAKLQQYEVARLVPLSFVKKIEYIRKKITEVRTSIQKDSYVKVETGIYNQTS